MRVGDVQHRVKQIVADDLFDAPDLLPEASLALRGFDPFPKEFDKLFTRDRLWRRFSKDDQHREGFHAKRKGGGFARATEAGHAERAQPQLRFPPGRVSHLSSPLASSMA